MMSQQRSSDSDNGSKALAQSENPIEVPVTPQTITDPKPNWSFGATELLQSFSRPSHVCYRFSV